MTRSSEICSDADGAVSVRTSIPSRHGSSLASSERLPATGRDWRRSVAHIARTGRQTLGGGVCFAWCREKRRQVDRCVSGLRGGEGHGRPRGPLPWPMCAAAVAATITLRRFVPSSLFFGVFLFRVFPVLRGSLTACTPLCCT